MPSEWIIRSSSYRFVVFRCSTRIFLRHDVGQGDFLLCALPKILLLLFVQNCKRPKLFVQLLIAAMVGHCRRFRGGAGRNFLDHSDMSLLAVAFANVLKIMLFGKLNHSQSINETRQGVPLPYLMDVSPSKRRQAIFELQLLLSWIL